MFYLYDLLVEWKIAESPEASEPTKNSDTAWEPQQAEAAS